MLVRSNIQCLIAYVWHFLPISGGKLPFAQLPVLEVDGELLAQSNAIIRFVASRYGKSKPEVVNHLNLSKWSNVLSTSFPGLFSRNFFGKTPGKEIAALSFQGQGERLKET